MRFDQKPYVLEDAVSIRLVEDELLRSIGLIDEEGNLGPIGQRVAPHRGLFVGRARLFEDLVIDSASGGVDQYVILGAGLDTFCQRRPDLLQRLRVFEIDEPTTQQWKQDRLRELDMKMPARQVFVPLDFEHGRSWVEALKERGFDVTAPSTIASTGVAQYITGDAMRATMQEAAALAAGTTLVCTFVVPVDLIDAKDREIRAFTEQGAAAMGAPWISFYSPEEFRTLALDAGFDDVRHISPVDLTDLYFRGRPDGLRIPSNEHLIVAARSQTAPN